MDFPDLSKIGAPNWLTAFFTGNVLGGASVFGLYENFRLPGLELSLHETHQRVEDIEKAASIYKKHAEELDVQVRELNKEYKSQNEQLANQRNECQNRDSLLDYMNDLKSNYNEASKVVIEFASLESCITADCNLSSSQQRRLKALEGKRDQLYAQILDLQSRLTR